MAGLAIANGLSGAAGGVLVGGLLLLWLGLADDRSRRGGVAGWKRLAVEVFAGLLAWGAGASAQLVPGGLAGFVLSMAFLVLIPNAFAALDMMGGLAA
ncbi:MAG TPA: hypothetical protein VKY26_05620, partial [Actinomycetota bacterium]|nr:hypothetical protein [Actinomycetota bacterium]